MCLCVCDFLSQHCIHIVKVFNLYSTSKFNIESHSVMLSVALIVLCDMYEIFTVSKKKNKKKLDVKKKKHCVAKKVLVCSLSPC